MPKSLKTGQKFTTTLLAKSRGKSMTEHYAKVNQRQLEIEAEKWGETVTMIEAAKGRTEG